MSYICLKANAVEIHKQNYKLITEKAQLEQTLVSKVNDIRALKREIEELKNGMEHLSKLNESLQNEVESLKLQVQTVCLSKCYDNSVYW